MASDRHSRRSAQGLPEAGEGLRLSMVMSVHTKLRIMLPFCNKGQPGINWHVTSTCISKDNWQENSY